jgi:hypothetical protein
MSGLVTGHSCWKHKIDYCHSLRGSDGRLPAVWNWSSVHMASIILVSGTSTKWLQRERRISRLLCCNPLTDTHITVRLCIRPFVESTVGVIVTLISEFRGPLYMACSLTSPLFALWNSLFPWADIASLLHWVSPGCGWIKRKSILCFQQECPVTSPDIFLRRNH